MGKQSLQGCRGRITRGWEIAGRKPHSPIEGLWRELGQQAELEHDGFQLLRNWEGEAGRLYERMKINQQREMGRGFAGAAGQLLPAPHLICAAVWLLLVKIMKIIPGRTVWLLPWELLQVLSQPTNLPFKEQRGSTMWYLIRSVLKAPEDHRT